MGWLNVLARAVRTFASRSAYACCRCGEEIFTAPKERLCPSCEGLMTKNDGKTCPKCGRPTLAEGICWMCKERPPDFDRGYAAFSYGQDVSLLVNRMKNGEPWLANYFGSRMAEYALRYLKDELIDCKPLVLPVPLGENAKKRRSYNQAERIAEIFCARLREAGVRTELCTNVLVRTKEIESQKDANAQTRFQNAEESYRLREKSICKDRLVLVVDDIMTTGATGNACSKQLRKYGAKKILFIAACAAPEKKEEEGEKPSYFA